MNDADWDDYFAKRIGEAEKALADFENAVAKHGLRAFHRFAGSPEQDVTEQHRQHLQKVLKEYKTMQAKKGHASG